MRPVEDEAEGVDLLVPALDVPQGHGAELRHLRGVVDLLDLVEEPEQEAAVLVAVSGDDTQLVRAPRRAHLQDAYTER